MGGPVDMTNSSGVLTLEQPTFSIVWFLNT